MTNQPHRHHYIPQFWIKNWCGQDGMVQRFTKHGHKISSLRKSPRGVGWHKNLYRLPSFNDGNLDLETLFFKRLDQHASDIFDLIKERPEVNFKTSQIDTLSTFIISILLRGPIRMAAFGRVAEVQLEAVRNDLRHRYNSLRGENDPATVEEYERLEGDNAPMSHFARIFPYLIANHNIISFLREMHWMRIPRQGFGYRFLLSDAPIIRSNGLKKHDGHIAIPITPDILVIGAHERKFLDLILDSEPKKIFTEANNQVVQSARNFVVDKDERQFRFIENRFGSKIQSTIPEDIFRNQLNF